jgi:hypothetical protein
MIPHVPDVSMEEVIATSFRDYHVKGFDYICLKRSPQITVKLYFFDGDLSNIPEVVNPHNHRYCFRTICVAGAVDNFWYRRDMLGKPFQRFAYRTPLNGGKGFTWDSEDHLAIDGHRRVEAGRVYFMQAHEIHTIRIAQSETVLALLQYEDVIHDDVPTRTWTRDKEPPSLDGMYRRFDADTIRDRLWRLQERVPSLVLPRIV